MKDYRNFMVKEILGKKSVEIGDIIMTTEPFAYVVSSYKRGEYCDNCLTSSRNRLLYPCDTCGFTWYCNKTCMANGREVHKNECLALKRLSPYIPPNYARLLARIIFKLKDGGDKLVEKYSEKKGRRFKDLMNHYRDIKEDIVRRADVESIRKVLQSFIGEKNLPNESDFMGLYGRVLVNRFCLMDEMMIPFGSAVFLAASIFDHSCKPNAFASFHGRNLVIRSLIHWDELDLTKVRISYVDVVNTTEERRMELQRNWYFLCDCQLCNDKIRHRQESSMKCGSLICNGLVYVPEEHVTRPNADEYPSCENCGRQVSAEELKCYKEMVSFTRCKLKYMKEDCPDLAICREVLEKQDNLLHKLNAFRVRALDFTFNAAFYAGAWTTAWKIGTENYDGMRYYYGPDHPTFGLYLMKLGKVVMYFKMYKEGLKYVTDAEELLKVALGAGHYLVSNEIERLKLMANEDVDIALDRKLAKAAQRQNNLICRHCGRRTHSAQHEEPQTKIYDWEMEMRNGFKFDN